VAYKEDLNRVIEVLNTVADKNPLCMEEPRPLFNFEGFGTTSLDFQYSVWALRENYLQLKNSISIEIKDAFDAEGIEIPFPLLSLYAGSMTAPYPVRLGDPSGTFPNQD